MSLNTKKGKHNLSPKGDPKSGFIPQNKQCRDHCPAPFSYFVWQKGFFTIPLTVGNFVPSHFHIINVVYLVSSS